MKAFILLLCSIALSATPLSAVTAKKPTKAPEPPCCREGLPPGKFSEKSLYSLDSTWTADVGREVKLEALRGRPQVVALFFTSCQHSCPLIVKDMKAIEKGLPANVRGKVDFLLVSIDPERDTPEALRAFREKYALPIERWSLLRGKVEDVKKLAELMGFRYYPGSNLQYAHSLLITVLNPAGEIVFQQSGVGNTRDEALAAVLRLVAPKEKPARL
jgi:protein SCO1/2